VRALYVEDDPEDVALMRLASAKCDGNLEFHILSDGETAMSYLATASQGEAPRPDIILLDINLPKRDGFSVLEGVKAGPLKATPVMMLSSSSAETDVTRAYASGASVYFEKPSAMRELCELVKLIERLWAFFARLPPSKAAS
jgi:DNA-binding response OmpR family regulator